MTNKIECKSFGFNVTDTNCCTISFEATKAWGSYLDNSRIDQLKALAKFNIINIYSEALDYNVYYGKNKLNTKFIADFFCYDDIILEIKAVSTILPENEAQIINYLKATSVRLGILVNFGSMSLTHKRYLNI